MKKNKPRPLCNNKSTTKNASKNAPNLSNCPKLSDRQWLRLPSRCSIATPVVTELAAVITAMGTSWTMLRLNIANLPSLGSSRTSVHISLP